MRLTALKFLLCAGFLSFVAGVTVRGGQAQAPAPPPASSPVGSPPAASRLGTVKAISGNAVTLATDAGATVTVTVPDGAKVQQLAVGSTDLKTATPSQFSAIAVGDRVLASGKPGDAPGSFTAARIVLMKSGDIAQMQAAQQEEWTKNGLGGIVTAVDPASGAVTISSGTKKVTVGTSGKTLFRRFANGSQQYQDAKSGTFAQIQVGDQLQARGTKSDDGSSVQAVEVVSGSFKNLSGVILTVDPAVGNITLKDLATKKLMTINVTPNSNIRTMPAQMASTFAARQGGGGGRGGAAAGGTAQAGAAPPGGGGGGCTAPGRPPAPGWQRRRRSRSRPDDRPHAVGHARRSA